MSRKDIRPAVASVMTHTGTNFDWVESKMDLDGQTMTMTSTDKAYFYVKMGEEVGQRQIDGNKTNIHTNALEVTIQAISYTENLNILEGEKNSDDEDQIALMQEDILAVLGDCYNAIGDAGVRTFLYQYSEDATAKRVKKGTRAVRKDFVFEAVYEQR